MTTLPTSADLYVKVTAFALDPLPVDQESSSPVYKVVSFRSSALAFDSQRTEVGWIAQWAGEHSGLSFPSLYLLGKRLFALSSWHLYGNHD